MQPVISGTHLLKQCQVLKQLALNLYLYSGERIQKEVECRKKLVCSAKSFFQAAQEFCSDHFLNFFSYFHKGHK